MSALLPPLDYPLSIFTPSTVQCTRFYSDASIHSLKKNNDSIFFSNIKRYQVDINSKKLESKPNFINHDHPNVKLKNRKQETFSCLDEHLAENVRTY
jgi:hypothetical protein